MPGDPNHDDEIKETTPKHQHPDTGVDDQGAEDAKQSSDMNDDKPTETQA